MARILIIDDDSAVRNLLLDLFVHQKHQVDAGQNLKEAGQALSEKTYDVVFLDVNLPDGSGLDLLKQIRRKPDPPVVIIITGYGDPDGAELAIKSGAWDYVEKSYTTQKIILALNRAIQYIESKANRQPLRAIDREGIIGDSRPMKACLDQIAKAAGTDVNVLIYGETGTGKELVARAIHRSSLRADKPFIIVDCASLPENITESILFGHEKGAFTGAERSREGLIKQAHKGTLFLDEVGELSPNLQKSFLRVLETRKFSPVGSNRTEVSDFRLVAATNRNLDRMAGEGRFREDLLFRLKAVIIHLPPLKEHKEDLRDIIVHHMDRICSHHNTTCKGFDPEIFDILNAYDWPGNVRELVHALEIAYTEAGDEPFIRTWHLPLDIRSHAAKCKVAKKNAIRQTSAAVFDANIKPPSWSEFKKLNEGRYFRNLLEYTDGSVIQAADISGLGRTRIYDILKKHGITFENES